MRSVVVVAVVAGIVGGAAVGCDAVLGDYGVGGDGGDASGSGSSSGQSVGGSSGIASSSSSSGTTSSSGMTSSSGSNNPDSGIGSSSGESSSSGATSSTSSGVATSSSSSGSRSGSSGVASSTSSSGNGSALPDSSTSEAAAEGGTGEAGTIDGTTSDVGASDSQVPVDAANASDVANGDAKQPSDAGGAAEAGDWCLANSNVNTQWCRDFDDSYSYEYGFSSTFVNLYAGGMPPTIVSTVSASPPNSLLFILPLISCTGDGGSSSSSCSEQVQLNTNVLTKSLLQAAFAIRIVNYDQNNVHDLSLVRISYNQGAWAAAWDLQLASSTVFETVATDGGALVVYAHQGVVPPLNEWVNVVFSVDIAAKTVSLVVGTNSPVVSSVYAPPISGTAVVTVGINNYIGPSLPMSVYLDNVLISHD